MKYQGETQGNGSVVVLIHDTTEVALNTLDSAILAALRHFGIPFQVQMVEPGIAMDSLGQYIASHAAVLVPQSGTFSRISEAFSQQLRHAVAKGLGLICYEPEIAGLPTWLQNLVCDSSQPIGKSSFSVMATCSNNHFITWTRETGERVRSDLPLALGTGLGKHVPLLVSEQGEDLMAYAVSGEGRVVVFPFDAAFFTLPFLGHACGADDVFTRSIIWAARKPFLTWSMPAFAGLVVDDCSGSYDHFGYHKVMKEFGWSPYLSLFTETIDEVAHEDIHKTARVLHDGQVEGTLDINFHALRYNDSFCFNHLERRSLTTDELTLRFAQWDRYEKLWGVRHGVWAHPHFGEIGSNAIPYFLERGIGFLTYLLPFDAAWFDVPAKIDPVAPQPPFGHPGYYMVPHQDYPSLQLCNCVLDRKSRTSSDYVVQTDYLWGHTPFWSEAPQPMLKESAQTLAAQIRRGIDSGFYGEGATHEQRIACLREGEFREIFQETHRLLSRYNLRQCNLNEILPYMGKHRNSCLTVMDINRKTNSAHFAFSNESAVGTELQWYDNEQDDVCLSLFTVAGGNGTLTN
ncbi:MAG: hypothetical protein CVV52_07855 [Spirochaetae bacterium HGW-Spirochaetae-8]|nr:MAG: hypothetical protein CVV52_07855 [Spirochaetae bacterium HGW-Spirochaetae-8]